MNPTNFLKSLNNSGWIYIVFKYYSIPKQAFEVQVKIWWLLNKNSTIYTIFFLFLKNLIFGLIPFLNLTIQLIFKECDGETWSGLVSLWIGTCVKLL
jgi:hypothetical protein